MIRWEIEGGVPFMDELEKVIARYTAVGMAADEGKTVLTASRRGRPGYVKDEDGELWIPLFSERADADVGGARELLLMPMADVFRFQMESSMGQGLVLDPFTDPLWIPNGMIPVLLDAGRHLL